MCLTGAMLGCSPALNWREVALGTGSLHMLLPCKPDFATREVSMGVRLRSLSMVGCEADGMTFAVSHVLAADTAEAQAVLDGWKSAVLAHARAATSVARPFNPPGGWAAPQAIRMQVRAHRADGADVAMDASWFARVDAAGVHLYHAVVLAPQPAPQSAETFFASLAWR